MRKCFIFVFFLSFVSFAVESPKEIWKLTTGLAQPESSYYDPESKVIYVSNISGEALNKDGVGWISKVGMDGKIIEEKWVSGLNAPKGIRVFQGKLWVSDIDTLIGIDIQQAKITDKIQISEAKFLNDVAISEEGDVFVSDMLTNKIYQIKGNEIKIFAEGKQLESPNGLVVSNGKLFVGGWGKEIKPDFTVKEKGSLYSLDLKNRKLNKLVSSFGNLDGLELAKSGDWIFSDWMKGSVYLKRPTIKKPLEIISGLKGAADIGYIADKNILLVPEMNTSMLHAYEIGAQLTSP